MKTNIARREFLRVSARNLGLLGVGSIFYESMLSGLFQKAFAATNQQAINPSGYYLHFSLPGGPPRWYFDLPLAPNGITASNFIQGGFGTYIDKSGSNYISRYVVEKHKIGSKTIYLPPVWNMPVAKPFTSLLPHTVFIRGMDMEINSHPLSNGRQLAPIIGGNSISGMVADGALRSIPSVSDPSTASRTFKSKKGLAANYLDFKKNPVATLLEPFNNYMKNRSVHNPQMVPLQEQALKEFEKYAQARGIASTSLSKMYDNAIELIANDIYQLSTRWDSTVKKYSDLIDAALNPSKGSLPGIFDKAIPSQSIETFQIGEGGLLLKSADARDMFTSKVVAPRMAEYFAACEILLDKVTSTMCFSFGGLTGLMNGTSSFGVSHDQHLIGSVVSTMTTTLFYRAFLACLTEYVEILKVQGIFEKTVIHIAAEWNRAPRTTGAGADHGVGGSNTTIISGMVRQPAVIGNIQVASLSPTYSGTWGVAKDYALGGLVRPIQVNDVARTITTMLGVDDIVTNGRALLQGSGNLWEPRLEEAKNV